jgi:hypothetical protein
LLSAMRRLMPGKTPPEKASGMATMHSSASISAAEGARPRQKHAGYEQSQFQQRDYAPQPQPAVQQPYYPYAQQSMEYPQTQPWRMQPPQTDLAYQQPSYAGQQPYSQQAAPPRQPAYPQAPSDEAHSASQAAGQQTPIEEIRASLREFREAVRELTESRTHRRYF